MEFLDRFRSQMARDRGAPAIAGAGGIVSYGEFGRRVRAAAAFLARRGVGREDVVAVGPVAPGEGADFLAVLLATWTRGASYLIVDAEWPAARSAAILADAAPYMLVGTIPAGASFDSVPFSEAVAGDEGVPDAGFDEDPSAPGSRGGDLAYVLYTSGTTGTPKGVAVERRNVDWYVRGALERYPTVAGSVLMHTNPAFDLSVTSMITPLAAGGCVVWASPGEHPAAAAPTFVKATPSHLPRLEQHRHTTTPDATLVLGGEPLHGSEVRTWRDAHPRGRVVNAYGPTELTVNCTEHVLAPGDATPRHRVPIGTPFAGVEVLVLDERLEPVPAGGTGELYVAGEGLTRGYRGRPALTAARFVAHPGGRAGARVYRTGDVVRWTSDGLLEYIGRADHQLQVRGHRVEPEEIETRLVAHPDVARAAVTAAADGDGTLRAHVVPVPGREVPAPGELRRYLATELPEHMIPTMFIPLASLPLTGNGKLDRRGLPAAGTSRPPGDHAPDAPTSWLLRTIWELTGSTSSGPDDDLFLDLGLHSLAVQRLTNRVRSERGVDLSAETVFAAGTVGALERVLLEGPGLDRPPLSARPGR